MGLIRLLAIIAVVYLIFRLLGRFALPWLTRLVLKKAGDRMQEQAQTRSEGEKIYQDEKVTIRKTSHTPQNKAEQDDDEYIDFEEVKD